MGYLADNIVISRITTLAQPVEQRLLFANGTWPFVAHCGLGLHELLQNMNLALSVSVGDRWLHVCRSTVAAQDGAAIRLRHVDRRLALQP